MSKSPDAVSDEEILALARSSGIPTEDLDAVRAALESSRGGASQNSAPSISSEQQAGTLGSNRPEALNESSRSRASGLMAMRQNLRSEAWGDIKMGPFALGFHDTPKQLEVNNESD